VPPPVPIVYLIRHAQASFGTADYDVLSAVGLEQVDALHVALLRRGLVPSRIVSGSLRRQRDTALACGNAAAVEIDTGFDEYDSDAVMSHHSPTNARVERRPGDDGPALSSREFQVVADDALKRWVDAGAAGGARQTWPAFLDGVRQALDRAASDLGSGGTAAVFTSSGVIAALTATLIGAPDSSFVPLNRVSVNTSVTKVILGSRGMTLVSFNEHSHLDETGGRLVTYR
jgi:broad specificity phosphatase PhoE